MTQNSAVSTEALIKQLDDQIAMEYMQRQSKQTFGGTLKVVVENLFVSSEDGIKALKRLERLEALEKLNAGMD